MYAVRKCSSFFHLQVVDQFSQHHLLKKLSFFHCIFLCRHILYQQSHKVSPWIISQRKSLWNYNPPLGSYQFSSVTQSCPTLRPHGLQHTGSPCPSPAPRACSCSCPLSRLCHPTISSSLIPFRPLLLCLQSFPASGKD